MNMGTHSFVIQKHKATSLHYDFRLEVGGSMPSWSIPKGPSMDNTVKRLAMPTTDHDLSYRNFEGVIAQGNYGAGPVMIWDEGTFNPEIEVAKGIRQEITDRKKGESALLAALKRGDIKFTLYGEKLHGSFALVKTRGFGGKESWLLIKHNDKFARKGYDAKEYPKSARSGKTIEEIAGVTEE